MKHTRVLKYTVDGTLVANATEIQQPDGGAQFTGALTADSETEIDIAFASPSALVITSDVDITVRSNADAASWAADDTLEIAGGVPLAWMTGDGPCPFGAAVTKLFITTVSAANVKIYVASDVTPAEHAPVAFDTFAFATDNAGTGSYAFSFEPGAGSDRYLVVLVTSSDTQDSEVTGVAFATVPMTLLGSALFTHYRVSAWGLAAPALGSGNDVEVTYAGTSSSGAAAALSFTGVAGPRGFVARGGNDKAPRVTVPSEVNDLVAGFAVGDQAPAGLIVNTIWDDAMGANQGTGGTLDGEPREAQFIWAGASAGYWAAAGVALRPV